MACFRPLEAYQDDAGGAPRLGGYWAGENGRYLELPCGHCAGCRMDRRLEWSIRCTHEAQLYDSNLFVSLDYSPEKLPESRSLEYRDVQLWLKRLRKAMAQRVRGKGRRMKWKYTGADLKNPVRFFLCGEYGSTTLRPHWHAILFNVWFKDQVRLLNGTYQSDLADKIWQNGRCVIGDVTPQSISYVAGYTTDKLYGRGKEEAYEVVDLRSGEVKERRPELVSMSRRPGIGYRWFERFRSDIFGGLESPHDFAVHEKRKRKVPRYYWRLYNESGDAFAVEKVREARLDRAAEVDKSEETLERRAVREEALLRRVKTFSPRKGM